VAATTTALLAPQVSTDTAADALDAGVDGDEDPRGALRVGDRGVNMRVGPATTTGIIRTLQPGEPLAMGETLRGWVAVKTEDGETGWVYSSYLIGPALESAGVKQRARTEQVPQSEKTAKSTRDDRDTRTAPKRFARVNSDTYLRARPSHGSKRLFLLPAGERVSVAEIRGSWARVVLTGGESGWVRIR
jgi:SH3-like domain-containing protein